MLTVYSMDFKQYKHYKLCATLSNTECHIWANQQSYLLKFMFVISNKRAATFYLFDRLIVTPLIMDNLQFCWLYISFLNISQFWSKLRVWMSRFGTYNVCRKRDTFTYNKIYDLESSCVNYWYHIHLVML